MEDAAKRYARRILLVHLLLLAGVLVLVFGAARETYQQARQQVLDQAQSRQELLAAQTAKAVQEHYGSILANLQLIRRAEEADHSTTPQSSTLIPEQINRVPAMRIAEVLWTQLDERAKQLFVVSRQQMQVKFSLPAGSNHDAQSIADFASEWLNAVNSPTVSSFVRLRTGGANLVAVPFLSDHLIVAVVPISVIETRFLNAINRENTLSATLLDADGRTMTTSDRSLIGGNVFDQLHDPPSIALLRRYMTKPRLLSSRVEKPLAFADTTLPPRMITAVPVAVQAEDTEGAPRQPPWTLLIASHLSDVDSVVQAAFGRALIWAIVVALALGGILISTAVQMIRGRNRLENLRNQALRDQIAQARQIQLAWLPASSRTEGPIKIAAVNQPANHISGDFYDWFDLPDGRTVVSIGDVTGHGMSAAFLMATTQLLVRNTMPRLLDPGQCLTEVNRQLCSQVFSGQFVTMLVVVIDLRRRQLAVATAGHFPPMVRGEGSFYPLKVPPQLVLGIEKGVVFPSEHFDLPDNADIVLYTDGVLDAVAPDGTRFGPENLDDALVGQIDSPEHCLNKLLTALASFRGEHELVDDLTIVAVEITTPQRTDLFPAHEAADV